MTKNQRKRCIKCKKLKLLDQFPVQKNPETQTAVGMCWDCSKEANRQLFSA